MQILLYTNKMKSGYREKQVAHIDELPVFRFTIK